MTSAVSMLRPCMLCVLASALGLFVNALGVMAEEPHSAIDAYMAKPATAFDLFLMSANHFIAAETDVLFSDSAARADNLTILARTKHELPPKLLATWRSQWMLKFYSLDYDSDKDAFEATFFVMVMPEHPIYEEGLDREGEQARIALAKRIFSTAQRQTRYGIIAATSRNAREASRLQFAEEVAQRTKINVTWDIMTEGGPLLGDPMPKTLSGLADKGIYTRHYKLSGHLQDGSGDGDVNIAVTYQDSRSKEEALQRTMRNSW